MKIPEQILEEIMGNTESYEQGFRDGWATATPERMDAIYEVLLKREGDLRKEIAELKAQLEIAKKALKFECGNRCAIGLNPCNARQALDELETTGE